jgi:flagellar hook capping protein FlgD
MPGTPLPLRFGCAAVALLLLASARPSPAAFTAPLTVGSQGNEPLIAVAPDRTIVISALQYLYASTDGGATFFAVARPPFAAEANLASDSSINFDSQGRLYFTFDWPYAGATAVCTADSPLGPTPTWTSNPSALPGATDRMWIIAPSTSAAYAVTNQGLYETTFLTSADRGLTWTPRGFGPGLLEPQTGPLLSDPAGTHVFQVAKSGGELGFYVYTPSSPGEVVGEYRGTGAPAPLALPSGAFATDGTLWTSTEASNGTGGYLVEALASTDQGVTWRTLPPVPGTTTGTSTFSWVAAGAPGHVGVLYYRTPSNGHPNTLTNATWDALWAETFDAGAASPHWTVTTLETGIRTGAICIAAGCSGTNRFAGDFISSIFDPDGVAHLTWMRAVPLTVRYARVVGSAVAVSGPELPARHWLGAPVPNPASRGTAIRYGLARATTASLTVFDLTGRHLRTLAAGRLEAGVHEAAWDGRDENGRQVGDGIYFVRLLAGGETHKRTVVTVR